ncbi:TetR family transcriptional regulator C-terminal domain-containing protein [Acidisoma sp. L85]|uniref:TetR family transcriptional regulator C-terminal domain-containing protein n=1 Tax=Acidisoma sp. L85 TaxID=1641850 RepID=UPI00352ADAF7
MNDREHKGCFLVNSALEMAPHDPEFRKSIARVLKRIEAFFLVCVQNGQADGTITCSTPAEAVAQHFLGVLLADEHTCPSTRASRACPHGGYPLHSASLARSPGKSIRADATVVN